MSNIKIGWASRDVSSDKPLPILGQAHVRVSQGIHDPITTTALVLDDGKDCVIFVSLDTVYICCGLLDEMRAKLKALRPEIPVEKVLMNATHTHCAPSHNHDWTNFRDGDTDMPITIELASSDEYRDFLSTQQAEMAAEAWDKRSEGSIAYGYGYAVTGHSRRVWYFDDLSKRADYDITNTFAVNGHAAMYGNTNDDNFSHYEAGSDHFINLLYTFDKAGALTGALINVPCPSQCSEHLSVLTASYWNEVRLTLREKYGKDLYILPQCAGAGDLSPRVLHYKAANARRLLLKYGEEEKDEMLNRRDIAERIANAFDEVLSWAKKDIRTEMPITHSVTTVNLSRRIITEDEFDYAQRGYAAAQKVPFAATDDHAHDFMVNSAAMRNRLRFKKILKSYEEQKTEKTLPMEMHIIKIGSIAFASHKDEVFMDYMHRIQARSPFEQTFLVQLAAQPGQERSTYLPTTRAEEGKGYSAIIFSTSLSPEGGQEFVDKAVEELKRIY